MLMKNLKLFNQVRWRFIIISMVIISINSTLFANESNLRIPLIYETDSFNPILNDSISSAMVNRQIYEGLFELDENDNVIPVLVDRWKINDDGTECLFTLKKKIYFHNGTELTSNDVLESFKKMTQISNTAKLFNSIKGVELFKRKKSKTISGIEIVNKYQFKISFKHPFYDFYLFLCDDNKKIMPSQLISNGHDFKNNPVGTGPYKLIKNHSTSIHLGRFDKYHNYLPYFKTLTFLKSVKDPVSAFIKNKIDLFYTQNPQGVKLPKNIPHTTITSEQYNIWFLQYNTNLAPFDSLNLRKAFYWAIDPEKFLDIVGTTNIATDSILLPGLSFISTQKKVVNLKLAKDFIKKSNLKKNTTVKLLVVKNMPKRKEISDYLVSALSKLGIKVKIVSIGLKEFIQQAHNLPANTFMLQRLSLSLPNQAIHLSSLFNLENNHSTTKINDKVVKDNLNKSFLAMNQDDKIKLYSQIDERITNKAYFRPLMREKLYMYFNKKIKDINISSYGFYNTKFMYVNKDKK
jgi:peptide/nickel transport system substrate-binding protein